MSVSPNNVGLMASLQSEMVGKLEGMMKNRKSEKSTALMKKLAKLKSSEEKDLVPVEEPSYSDEEVKQ